MNKKTPKTLRSANIKKVYKVYGNYKDLLTCLKEVDNRWYKVTKTLRIKIVTNAGTLTCLIFPGFHFDGRSGGRKIDGIVPNLGTAEERLCWLVHDVLAYATCLNFAATNDMLNAMLKDVSKYNFFEAGIIEAAVTIAQIFDPWFGPAKPGEREYPNINLFLCSWKKS